MVSRSNALHAVVIGRNDQFMDQFLEAGANVNVPNPRFGTALLADFFGGCQLMKTLLNEVQT